MKMAGLLKFQLKTYFRGAGFTMPFIATLSSLYILYSLKPLEVLSGFMITGVILFLIMAWTGISINGQENDEIEQIMMLKVNSNAIYYIGKSLFLVILSLIYTAICVIYPVVVNLINKGDLFKRSLEVGDVVGAIMLISSSSICGAFVGNLFHQRVIKDRKTAYVLLALVCMIAVGETIIYDRVKTMKFVLWIIPNITGPSKVFSGAQYFDVNKLILVTVINIMYALVYCTVKCAICNKRKY